MAHSWTVWDYLTLAGALLLVLGYVLLRIKNALEGQGGCGSCSKGCASRCVSGPSSQAFSQTSIPTPSRLKGIGVQVEPLPPGAKSPAKDAADRSDTASGGR
jgi:hypothetical protein